MATPKPSEHLQPLVLADDTHQSASIIIATSILLFSALLFLLARLWIRLSPDPEQRRASMVQKNALGVDDILSALSVVLHIVQSALLLGACARGLGNTSASIPKEQLEELQKLYHASNVFYVLSTGCSKATVAFSMIRLVCSGSAPMVRVSKLNFSVALLWIVAMVLLFTLFDHPASSWRIIDRIHATRTKWTTLGITGCCMELAFVAIATWIVSGLQMAFTKKAVVVCLFATRLPLIVIVAAQLLALSSTDNTDSTLQATLFVCLSQLDLAYSICTASFPVFQRFADKLATQSGSVNIASHNTTTLWKAYGSRQPPAWETTSELDALPFNRKPLKETNLSPKEETDEVRGCGDVAHCPGTAWPDGVSLHSNATSEYEQGAYSWGDSFRQAI